MFDAIAIIGGLASIAGLVAIGIPIWKRRQRKQGPKWRDAIRVAEVVLHKIEQGSWKPDVVLGIGRSGGIWGGWLAGNLGSLPLSVIDVRYSQKSHGVAVEFLEGARVLTTVERLSNPKPKVLVVEGAASHGHTLKKFRDQFGKKLEDWDVRTAVLYKNPTAPVKIDFVGDASLEPWPVRFPWHGRNAYKRFLREDDGQDPASSTE